LLLQLITICGTRRRRKLRRDAGGDGLKILELAHDHPVRLIVVGVGDVGAKDAGGGNGEVAAQVAEVTVIRDPVIEGAQLVNSLKSLVFPEYELAALPVSHLVMSQVVAIDHAAVDLAEPAELGTGCTPRLVMMRGTGWRHSRLPGSSNRGALISSR